MSKRTKEDNRIHRSVWLLAGPMIISNISVPILGLVDTAILGHLDNVSHLGAVSVGATILAFLYWGFGFLRMGTTGLSAQAYGAQDQQRALSLLVRAMLLGLGLAAILLLLHRPLFFLALQSMSASPEVTDLAETYTRIRIFSAPAVLVTFACIGWFIGQQNTRTPLLIVVSTNLLNIVLDCLLIIGLKMGSAGAAYATLIAEYVGLAIALTLILRQNRGALSALTRSDIFDTDAYLKMLRVNRDLFVRTICLLFSLAFFTAMGARAGDNVLAANAILMQLILLTSYGMDGFAHAVEALCGKAIGARDKAQFYAATRATAFWSFGTAIIFASLYALSGKQLAFLFTDLQPVIALVQAHRIWIILMPLVAVWSYWLDGIFIGATRNQAMRDTMLASLLLVYLPVWYFTQTLGNTGLWIAFFSFSVARSVSLGLVFWRYNRDGVWFENQRAA